MLARMRQLAERREDFAFETTLASRSFVRWLTELQREGYDVHLLFLWLRSAELAVSRITERCVRGVMRSRRKWSGGVIAPACQIYSGCTFRWQTVGKYSIIQAVTSQPRSPGEGVRPCST
jgi:hypothetical protein